MINGNVAIFDDEPPVVERFTYVVTLSGNKVVIATGDVVEAERLIAQQFNEFLGRLCVDVAFVDVNLINGTGKDIVAMLLAAGMPIESMFNISNDQEIDGIPNRLGKDPDAVSLVLEAFKKDEHTPADVLLHTPFEVN